MDATALAATRVRACTECQAFHCKMHLWIHRVPSELNMSDLPSRDHFDLMKALGATWRAPRVARLFVHGSLADIERAVMQAFCSR